MSKKIILTRSLLKNRYVTANKPLGTTAIMLGLTYKCQCCCPHCGVDLQRQQKRNEMDKEEIMKVISDFISLGAWAIYFFGGEPLIVKEIFEYVNYAASLGAKTALDTNGFLLSENTAKKLKQAGLDLLRVSIDSPYEKKHDEMRGIKGIFQKALNGLNYCNNVGIIPEISTYATKENLKNGDLKKIIELAKKHNSRIRITSAICSGKWMGKYEKVLSPEETKIIHGFLEKGQVFWENIDSQEQNFYCSAMMKELIHVTPYGDIQPCCYCPVVFGNVKKEDIGTIVKRMWNSEVFKFNNNGDCPMNSKEFVDRYFKK